MISRRMKRTVREALDRQAAVALVGPRQVGKTTLASAMMKRCALILLGTSVGLGSAANGQTSAAPYQFFGQQFWMWPYDTALPYANPWYSPCYPFASCAAYRQFQLQERRRERFAELRREQPSPPPVQLDAWRGAAARQVAPTNDADVQPAYVESGRIREEHRHSGEYLQEFLNRQGRAIR